MTKLKTLLAITAAIVVAALALPPIMHKVDAQPVPSFVGPYNVDLGVLITNTAQIGGAAGDGIFGTPSVNNFDQSGVICTMNATVNSGSPSTTFSVQAFDAATATWHTIGTSGAVTATATPTSLIVYPGAVASSVPTGVTVYGLPVPRVWRISETVGSSSAAGVTAKIGCNIMR